MKSNMKSCSTKSKKITYSDLSLNVSYEVSDTFIKFSVSRIGNEDYELMTGYIYKQGHCDFDQADFYLNIEMAEKIFLLWKEIFKFRENIFGKVI